MAAGNRCGSKLRLVYGCGPMLPAPPENGRVEEDHKSDQRGQVSLLMDSSVHRCATVRWPVHRVIFCSQVFALVYTLKNKTIF